MAEWRLAHGWSDEELTERLDVLRTKPVNFDEATQAIPSGWRRYYTEAQIGSEAPGRPVPGGEFDTAWKAITQYQFSDPGIVMAHFNPKDELKGRTMLLELKVLGLHYLCGCRVTDIQKQTTESETVYGFRYDTLEGHIEVGTEWFLLTKKHDSGEVWFRISASWHKGDFPNWWSHVGFEVLGRRYQLAWHRLAYLRLREIVGSKGTMLVPVPHGEKLVHTGPEITGSDIWVLKQPSVAERVRELGKESAQVVPTEESVQ